MAPNTTSVVTVEGHGLITGKPVTVTLSQASPGNGIVFYCENDEKPPIPARLESVVNAERGVTLANSQGQTLSIVEHFLAAASFAGLSDLNVLVQGAPELPILDGSAQDWLDHFYAAQKSGILASTTTQPSLAFPQAIYYRGNGDVAVYALPSSHFQISYAIDFTHPELKNRWAHWDSQNDAIQLIAKAGTFGYVSELPAMQARGLAMGVTQENTLGLIETGGYTRDLRHDDEPIFHKMLDLLGDLTLTGINPLTLKAHIFAINAGHTSHIAFAKKMAQTLHI